MEAKAQPQSNSVSESINSLTAVTGRIGRIGRRLMPCGVVLCIWIILRGLRNRSASSLQNEAFVTGYSLASICVFLLLLGVRKRVLSVQVGRLAVWQQTHHYLGLLSVGAYALHANLFTTGWLESMLAISFWSIAVSGFTSWYVNRTSPRMLRAAGAQILRQDIPERSRQIAKQAFELALACAGKNDSAALADHYRSNLSPFFIAKRNLFYRLSPTGIARRKLLAGLENMDRYLSEEGRSQRRAMSQLVQAKDDLDFQSSLQNRIRFWAQAHTWVLGCFVVLAITHIVLAHQFTSGGW